jgi:hypothetical protein
MTDEVDWENFDSGPFCRHWGELGGCDEACARCGHGCNVHRGTDACDECDMCIEWVEADDTDTLKTRAEEAFK